jgi:hypothetical protein
MSAFSATILKVRRRSASRSEWRKRAASYPKSEPPKKVIVYKFVRGELVPATTDRVTGQISLYEDIPVLSRLTYAI